MKTLAHRMYPWIDMYEKSQGFAWQGDFLAWQAIRDAVFPHSKRTWAIVFESVLEG